MKSFLRTLALSLLLIVALLTVARRVDSGAWIAFESNREGFPAIFLMTGDGGSVRRITPEHMCSIEPRWSPRGGRIAFANSCTFSRNLLLIQPGGATPHILARSLPFAQTGHWSPSGEQLIVTRGESDLVLVDVDTRHERLLAGAYDAPLWSVDGAWIYASPLADPRNRLDRIHIETGRVEPVFSEAKFANPSWSPDGAQMVLVMQADGGDQLFVMAPDGSALHAISVELPPPRLAEPRWSPDGAWIAFLGGDSFIDQHLYRVRPDGRDLQRLTTRTGDLLNVQWSSDGEWLLFGANYERSWDIFRLRADGSSLENLTPGRARELLPQYAPVSGLDWRPLWVTVAALGILVLSSVWRFRP